MISSISHSYSRSRSIDPFWCNLCKIEELPILSGTLKTPYLPAWRAGSGASRVVGVVGRAHPRVEGLPVHAQLGGVADQDGYGPRRSQQTYDLRILLGNVLRHYTERSIVAHACNTRVVMK